MASRLRLAIVLKSHTELNKLCIHSDLRIEQLRNRATGLGTFSRLLKCICAGPGDLSSNRKMNLSDSKPAVYLVEGDCCLCRNALRRQTCISQLRRERHGKASSMRSGQQLLRICSDTI